jgi:hypothetical protein
MKTTITTTTLFTAFLAMAMPVLTACAQTGKPQTDRELRGRGMVVIDELEQGAGPKEGLNAITDAGNGLFSHMKLTQTGGATASFGGGSKMSFPRWVHVTWRQGPGVDMDWQRGVFVGGTIIGNYRVEVLSRIPEEIFRYVSTRRGRTIVLRFRIKDDGVLLAWDVQETVVHPEGSALGAFVFSMHGGDFPCENNPNRPHPNCTEGRLEDAPWYNPLWTRQ